MAEIFPVTPIGEMDITVTDTTVLLGNYEQNRELFFDAPVYIALSCTVPADSLQERNILLDFFKLHKGKLLPFWLRSYKKEFTLYEDALIGQNQIKVLSTKLYLVQGANKPITIYIDGIAFLSTVNAVTEESGPDDVAYEILSLSNNLPSTLKKSSGVIIERAYFVRFMQDTITFDFYDVGTSTVKLGFKELVYEYPVV